VAAAPRVFARNAVLPAVVAGLIAAAWLNQGTTLPETEAIAATLAASPNGSALLRARFPFLFLYRQTHDQELYFAFARATRGLPYDRASLVERGETVLDRAPEADGRWHRPYVEVPTEYPALLLPFMIAPSFVAATLAGYGHLFSVVMAACLLAGAWLAVASRPDRDGQRRAWWSLCALLLAQGALAVQKLDAVPALFVAGALWALVRRRPATAGVALGLAVAAKLVPVLLVAPIVAADLAYWRDRRVAARGAAGFVAALGVAMAPMLLPPQGLLDMVRYHGARGLQIESTWGALLGAWRAVAGTADPTRLTFGSYNLDGGLAPFFARASTPASVLAIAAITVWLARAPAPRDDAARTERIALALLASLVALWMTSKVFSPQYMTWALPAVLAVPGLVGRRLVALLVAAMAVTQLYLRGYYDYVTDLRPLGVATLLVRLAILAAFALVIAAGLRASRARAEVAS
jgi:hypothetical protein